MALKPKIQALIDFANETTEAGDERLGDAVKTLCDGYNGGGSAPSAFPTLSGEMSSKLDALLAYSNGVTGAGDTRIGDAIRTLCEGYGGESGTFTETFNLASFVSYSGYNLVNGNTPIGQDTTATSGATLYLTKTANVISKAIYAFDLSSIPAKAKIDSMTMKAKISASTSSTSRIKYVAAGLMKGDEIVASNSFVGSMGGVISVECGSWTRQELDDMKFIIYSENGATQVSTTRGVGLIGVELTITYTV